MNFHVITGLPRSGSTLLCNILNQRSDSFASSTSALPAALSSISTLLSNSPEETSRLANIAGTEENHLRIGRSLIETWHDTDAINIFDKSRGWSSQSLMLRSVAPESGIIVTVRDPRNILASIERQNAKTGLYNTGKSLFEICSKHVSDEGLIGAPIKGIEDLIRRNIPNVCFVEYEKLCSNPSEILRNIELVCKLEPHVYDFNNVESLATDLDVLYRNKYLHQTSSKVETSYSDWKDTISDDIANGTIERWPFFSKTFNYV